MTPIDPSDLVKGYTGLPQLVVHHVHRKPRKRKRTPGEPGMLTAAAAATLLGVSAKLVYKLFRSGELAGVKIAGAMRIHRESVTAYLSAHSNKKPAPPQPTPAPKRRRRSAASVGFVHLRPQQT